MATIKKMLNKKGFAWLADRYIKGKRVKRRFPKKSYAETQLASVGNVATPETIARFKRNLAHEGSVHFVQAVDGPIKIGFSSALENRLSTIATHNHGQLTVLGMIEADACYEKEMHRRFKHLILRGEWFRPESELLSFIEHNCQPSPISERTPSKDVFGTLWATYCENTGREVGSHG